MNDKSTYRTILRSSSIVGAAQLVNILSGILKMKVAAVVLGPAGVGLIGLYGNLIQTGAVVSGLGISSAGTRQIAAAAESGSAALTTVRRALFWGAFVLSLIGAVVFWIFSAPIADLVLNNPARASDVSWLAVGVALMVAVGGQTALLTGMRRIGDFARMNTGAGILGTAFGISALWVWGEDALLAIVLGTPVATFLLGYLFVARLGRPEEPPSSLSTLAKEWRAMLSLGIPFMMSGLVTILGHLVARSLVQNELGAEALGYFHASWTIGTIYLGFILGAMGADYYPRLTAAIRDHQTATRLVNEQTEVALLLCGPPLVAMLGFSPWLIPLLYSAEFGPAVEILRWQLLGDILKVMSWPLGFVILALGAGKTFVFTESVGVLTFVFGIWVALPIVGVVGAGMAFLGFYLLYLPLVYVITRRSIGFRWSRAVLMQAVVVVVSAFLVELAVRQSSLLGGVTGAVLALVLGFGALIRLADKVDASGKLAFFANIGRKVKRWKLNQ